MAWQPKGNIKGPQGAPGAQGATGAQGPPGTPGEAWWSGAGPPIGTAPGTQVGDWYLDTNSGIVYEKTSASIWTQVASIKGPKGDTGTQGSQGIQGIEGPQGPTGQAEAWYSGAGAPATGLGAVNDWYLNISLGDVYEKTATSTWTLRGNIKGPTGSQGPQGNTGATGSQGTQGPQGIQGPQGTTGAQGPTGQGVPVGGALAAILRKKSATDFDTEWKPLASLQQTAVAPTPTVGVTAKMLGMGSTAQITPTCSGKLLVTITASAFWTTGGNFFSLAGIRYGTGTPPTNGAASAGTPIGASMQTATQAAVPVTSPMTATVVVTGLTVGTAYWFDLVGQGSNAAAQLNITNCWFTITELP
jgi:hypothetical protein